MKLCNQLIGEVAFVVEESNSVPLPGGHGVWFPDVPRLRILPNGAPAAVARAYVCLVLLGDGEGEQRWNPKEWWPHALAWFDVYCPEIGSRLDGPRWAYLLAGLLHIVEKWSGQVSDRMHLKSFAEECHNRAVERLTPMTRRGQTAGFLSAAMLIPSGNTVGRTESEWRVASDELLGLHSAYVEMLYFMNVLHSGLGVAQHALDERYSSRLPFYRPLLRLLTQDTSLAEGLHESARRIGRALAETPLLTPAGTESPINAALVARLPACFQLANYRTRPPSRAHIKLRLANAPVARDTLLAAHDLAEAVADLLMDILRSGADDDSNFKPPAYDYLHSIVRYGPKMYEDQANRGTLPGVEPSMMAQPLPTGVPMTRSFAERMRSGLLVNPARERLSADFGDSISTGESRSQPFVATSITG